MEKSKACPAAPEISSEIEKYSRCYQDSSYRMGKRRLQRMKKDLDSVETTFSDFSLLDVGAGRGETVEYAKKLGFIATGIEIVPELCGGDILEGDIYSLEPDFAFIVTCYDMIEHLPPENLDKALDSLFNAARERVFLTISGNRAEKDGMTLHLSVFPLEFWENLIKDRCKDYVLTKAYVTEDDWHFACSV